MRITIFLNLKPLQEIYSGKLNVSSSKIDETSIKQIELEDNNDSNGSLKPTDEETLSNKKNNKNDNIDESFKKEKSKGNEQNANGCCCECCEHNCSVF